MSDNSGSGSEDIFFSGSGDSVGPPLYPVPVRVPRDDDVESDGDDFDLNAALALLVLPSPMVGDDFETAGAAAVLPVLPSPMVGDDFEAAGAAATLPAPPCPTPMVGDDFDAAGAAGLPVPRSPIPGDDLEAVGAAALPAPPSPMVDDEFEAAGAAALPILQGHEDPDEVVKELIAWGMKKFYPEPEDPIDAACKALLEMAPENYAAQAVEFAAVIEEYKEITAELEAIRLEQEEEDRKDREEGFC